MSEEKWTIGYSDGSGQEYIVDQYQSSVVTIRWGCSCCKDNVDSFDELKPIEQARMKLSSAAPAIYRALEEMVSEMKAFSRVNGLAWPDMIARAEAALKAARGEE